MTPTYGDVPALVVAALGSDWNDYFNVAVIGQATGAMLSDAITDVDGKRDNTKINYVVAWEITNDITSASVTADAAYDRYTRYCLGRRATGSKIVAMTVLPRTGQTADFETKRTQINTWIRANWANFADALADVANEANLSNASNTTYFSDGTHLTSAGNAIVVSLISAALSGIV